ncbi:PREDICTED: uncharacterized protein LOC109149566 isoform X3 [Ipomoea nil]|uniref:uncharacterized protein LOC109149566 isoform X3 n=1 Tax=Ipomoea nil TaxID=35883 RepID=UPI000901EA00|nr:PREDICTED: uncharacterized protein LOC109149566 isoform X3 [Ipomoea nil]
MEAEPTDMDVEAPPAEGLKHYKRTRRRKEQQNAPAEQPQQMEAPLPLPEVPAEDVSGQEAPPRVELSLFDDSVENHFRAIDTISQLCGEPDIDDSTDQAELRRYGSSITFLSEWRYFKYKPRSIRFACESEKSGNGKDVNGETILPQFSAATVPKFDYMMQGASMNEKVTSPQSCKDVVLYVGGSVWGIDWCPRAYVDSEILFQSEFVAIAAHPPGSSYHKIGAPLTGRGIIQIWCLLDSRLKEDVPSQVKKKSGKNSKKGAIVKAKSSIPQRPRGRPKKKPLNVSLDDKNLDECDELPLAVEYPEEPSTLHSTAMACENISMSQEDSRREKEISNQPASIDTTASKRRRLGKNARTRGQTCNSGLPVLTLDTNGEPSSIASSETSRSLDLISIKSSDNDAALMQTIPKDVALPRMILCLAHNGKVAWDIKWRPKDFSCCESRHRMGYLAVLLGSGALEVWEVPFPRIIKRLYSSDKEGTDPRFIKLEPVFRCSMLKCGDRQSIPLTVEWSISSSCDMILAGCHDGVVALWKFSISNSSKDTRPLLCFSADTVPIRSLAWAPFESSPESENVIITVSHKCLKFWDLRDPFHHLREYNPGQGVCIYSLDWLTDPRCIFVSCDDGSLRIQSLVKAANDFPITGKPLTISKQQGFHTYERSLFAIWSLHSSRLTGMVAYCGADGTAAYFQLIKQVENDPIRNRAPHFLCGSFVEEESVLTVITPMPDTPFRMMKTTTKWSDVLKTTRTPAPAPEPNQEKRANGEQARCQASDKELDPDAEAGSDDDQSAGQKKKQAPKSKSNSKKKPKPDQQQQDEGNEAAQADDAIELPPKSVAIHRVRWNGNNGSEKWLCYGGAAGIVRCQWIDSPPID